MSGYSDHSFAHRYWRKEATSLAPGAPYGGKYLPTAKHLLMEGIYSRSQFLGF